MFAPDQYALLDFGAGRKLELFGQRVVDRPAPAAQQAVRTDLARWAAADARYARYTRDTRDARDTRDDAARGTWAVAGPLPEPWCLCRGPLVLELQCAPSGAVGAYPEQAENWDWLDRQVRSAGRTLNVLNLFAYTGASTLAAAAAGARVAHVDAARPVVAWARRNAALSHLDAAPVRWLVDDARKFVGRELRRGHHYDGVILDPPTYGHGPQAQPWELARDLPGLLDACGRLTRRSPAFMLLTCHTPTIGPAQLEALLADTLGSPSRRSVLARPLVLRTADGRELSSGVVARWPAA